MKLVLGIALIFGALSGACYVAPTGAPAPAGATTKPESAAPAGDDVKPSSAVAEMAKMGIRTDVTFREAFAAAKAADKKEGAERGRGRVSLIMKKFSESLGVACKDCHAQKTDAEGEPLVKDGKPQLDYHAKTEMITIAERMWDEWVAPLRFIEDETQPVFCDSCHQGKAQFLDRTIDEDAMGDWMRKNFNAKFKKVVDGEEEAVKCGTCHEGKPAPFLDSWKTPATDAEEAPAQP